MRSRLKHTVKTREIISERYSQYLDSYDKILKKKSGYMFNMFVMRADLVDEYCSFLFDVLHELDKRVDTSNYSAFQARYPGRVGEILLNVWLDKEVGEQGLKVKEIQHIHMEPINWWNKGTAFLKAKFLGRRYVVFMGPCDLLHNLAVLQTTYEGNCREPKGCFRNTSGCCGCPKTERKLRQLETVFRKFLSLCILFLPRYDTVPL